MRMIMGEPPNERDGKIHGCPMKTMNEEQLTVMLRRMGITGNDLRDTVEAKKNEHFQIACQKGFNARCGPLNGPLNGSTHSEHLPCGGCAAVAVRRRPSHARH